MHDIADAHAETGVDLGNSGRLSRIQIGLVLVQNLLADIAFGIRIGNIVCDYI